MKKEEGCLQKVKGKKLTSNQILKYEKGWRKENI